MRIPPNHQATLDQVRVLGNETRLRILHHLTEAAYTEVELADRIGAAPRSLYYHLRILEETGLIQTIDYLKKSKKPQAVYRAVAESISLNSSAGGAEYREASAANILALLRIAAREVSASLESPLSERHELTFFNRHRLRLDKVRSQAFQKELDGLLERYSKGEGATVCFTAVAAPAMRKKEH